MDDKTENRNGGDKGMENEEKEEGRSSEDVEMGVDRKEREEKKRRKK